MAVAPHQALERRRLLVLRSAQAALVAQVLRCEEVEMVASDPELDEAMQELSNVALRIGHIADQRGWLDALEEIEEIRGLPEATS